MRWKKTVWFFLLGMLWTLGRVPAGTPSVLIVHGQNRFEDQRSLFYGEALVSWFKEGSHKPEDRIETFDGPEAFMAAVTGSVGPLRLYLSTHGVGEGQESELVVGKGKVKILELLHILEGRREWYSLWVDACYTGFELPKLEWGRVTLAKPGEEIEDDLLGLSQFGDRELGAFGLASWSESTQVIGVDLPKPGKFFKAEGEKTWGEANAFCEKKGEDLCGWKHWRNLPLKEVGQLCEKGEGASWLADGVGDGRAMIWLGCLDGIGGKKFGARSRSVASPEIGVRCCQREKTL